MAIFFKVASSSFARIIFPDLSFLKPPFLFGTGTPVSFPMPMQKSLTPAFFAVSAASMEPVAVLSPSVIRIIAFSEVSSLSKPARAV